MSRTIDSEFAGRIRKAHELNHKKSVKAANEVHAERERQVAEFIKNGGEIEVLDSRVSKKPLS